MKDGKKTKKQLIDELAKLRQRVTELEASETERKRAEQALRESEEKYRILAEGSLTGIFIHQDGKYVFVNDRFAEIHGYTPEELVEMDYRTLIHPDEREVVEQIASKRLAGEAVSPRYEVRRLRKDGKSIWCEMMATRIEYMGRPAIMGNIVDITERKRAEQVVRMSLEETVRGRRMLIALSQAAQAVQRARTPYEVYHTIGEEISALNYHTVIFTLTDDREHLAFRYSTFGSVPLLAAESLAGRSAQGFCFALVLGGVLDQVITERRSVFFEHVAEPMAEALPKLSRSVIGRIANILGLEQAICAPFIVGGDTHGLLFVTGAGLTEADVPAVNAFATQAAIALENALLFEQVQAGHEQLRWLTQQIVSAQEEERQRLSRELHDEAGQALTALKISLDLIQSDLPVEDGSLRQRLDEAIVLTDTTMEHIRSLAQDLRPPALDTVGLNDTLESFCRNFAERTRLSIDYAGTELPALPESADICLYRSLQEALTNVAKHAHANQVKVALHRDATLVSLSVEDNGQGFDVQDRMPTGIGLLGVRERLELLGGQLEIESRSGEGTRLTARIPLQQANVETRGAGDSRSSR